MAEQGSDCRSLFLREVQMFKEMVHVDGEKTYKNLVKSIKEISLRFVDDLRNAAVPAVVRSIRRKDGQHFKKSLSLKYTSKQTGSTRMQWRTKVGTRLHKHWCPTSSSWLAAHPRR